MSRTSGSGQGTKNHKPGCPCTVCKRVRGRQEPTGEAKVGGFSSPIAVPSIAEAHELASNPKALELSSQIAAHQRTIERLTSERTKLNEELAEVKRTAQSQRDTLKGRNQEIQALKTSDLAFRAAAWSAIETLTSGACKMPQDDPRFLTTSPTEMCGLLIEAVQYGRDGIEMAAVVGELLGIEGDPKRWEQQIEQALADRIEAAEGPLRAERDQWKAEAERWEAEAKRYQISTNNLGARVKLQSRVSEDAYPGDALAEDLPGGLLSGLPNPFRWLSRWIGGGK